jgi:archaellum biogenesis ATPase FlaH
MNVYGVYVTLSTPYATLYSDLKKGGVDVSRLFFIDCITKYSGSNPKPLNNCSFTDNQTLAEMSISIADLMNNGSYNFVFFDSMTTLLLYNSVDSAEKFLHYLINKLRDLGVGMCIIAVDDEKSREAANVISQFCDEFVDMTRGRMK